MNYILEVTHKNGKRLEPVMYVSKMGSLFINPVSYRTFDTESEAIRAAAAFIKLHKDARNVNYDVKVVQVVYPLEPNIKPVF